MSRLPKARVERGATYLHVWTSRFNFEFVAYMKEAIPSSHRDYDPDEKKWTVFAPYHASVDSRLHNFFDATVEPEPDSFSSYSKQEYQEDQADRARRAYQQRNTYSSAEDRFEQQQRSQAPPPKPPPTTLQDPYAVLFLTEKAPPEVVKASWKACMLICHPDRNQHRVEWTTSQSKAVNGAYQTIKKQLGF